MYIIRMESFLRRLLGAVYFSIGENEVMLFRPGGSIHTFFMRVAIDVAFLSKQGELLAVHENVLPWRVLICPKGTKITLEARAFAFKQRSLMQGCYLDCNEGNLRVV